MSLFHLFMLDTTLNCIYNSLFKKIKDIFAISQISALLLVQPYFPKNLPQEGLHCDGSGLLQASDELLWLRAIQGTNVNGALLLVTPVELPVDPVDSQARHQPLIFQDQDGVPWGFIHGDPEKTRHLYSKYIILQCFGNI